MSSARITKLLARVERLGIGRKREYIHLFEGFRQSPTRCVYWTNERCAEHHKTHPGPTIIVDCPFVPENEWIKLGGDPLVFDKDGNVIDVPPPEETPRPDCRQCEFCVVNEDYDD